MTTHQTHSGSFLAEKAVGFAHRGFFLGTSSL